MTHSRSPFLLGGFLALGLAFPAAGPGLAEPVTVPGGTESIRRLVGLVADRPAGTFLGDLHRAFVSRGNPRAPWESNEKRKAVVAFAEDLAEWRGEYGCPARLSARDGPWKRTKRAVEWLGYRVRGEGPGFTMEPRPGAEAQRRRAFLDVVDPAAAAALSALAAGDEVIVTCGDGAADLSPSLEAWREVLGVDEKTLNAATAFLHFVRNVPASRMLVALDALDPETREELRSLVGTDGSAGGWKLVFDEGLDAFARFPEALEIRNGRIRLPGGPEAEAAWADVVGASPSEKAGFVEQLFGAESGKAAYVVDALRQVPEPVARAFVLGKTGGGERAVQRFRRLYASIESAGGNFGKLPRDAFDFWQVAWTLRAGRDGDLEIPGGTAAWLPALSGAWIPEDETELGRLLSEAAGRTEGPEDVLVRVFRNEAGGTGAVSTAQARWIIVSNLVEEHPVLADAGTILLLWRGFDRLHAAFAPLEELPLDDPAMVRRFFFTVRRLDTGGSGREDELVAGLFQASVELLAALSRSGALPDAKARELFGALLDVPLFAKRGVRPPEGIGEFDRWLSSGLLGALRETEVTFLAGTRRGEAEAQDGLDAPHPSATPDDLLARGFGGWREPVRFDYRGSRYEWDPTADGAARRRAFAATQEHVPLAALAEATAAREKAVAAAKAGDVPGALAAFSTALEQLDAARQPGRGEDARVALVARNARVAFGDVGSGTVAGFLARLVAGLSPLDALRAERTLEALEVHLYSAAAGDPSDLAYTDPLFARRHSLSWAGPTGGIRASPFGPTRIDPPAEGRVMALGGSFSGLAPTLGLLHAEELVYDAKASLPNGEVRTGLVAPVVLVTVARLDEGAFLFVDLACRAAEQLAAALGDRRGSERLEAWSAAARGLVPSSRRNALASAATEDPGAELSPSDLFRVGRRLALAEAAPDPRAPAAAAARAAWTDLVARFGEAGATERVAELGPRASAWAGSSRLSDRDLPSYERLAEYRTPHLFADRVYDLKVSAARALVRDGDPAPLLGLTLGPALDELLRGVRMTSAHDWRPLAAPPTALGRTGRDEILAAALASGRIARVGAPEAK